MHAARTWYAHAVVASIPEGFKWIGESSIDGVLLELDAQFFAMLWNRDQQDRYNQPNVL
jgi:hypothetical protein